MSAVTLSGVGKRYRKYSDSAVLIARGRERIRRTTRSETWALRGIDLEVERTECLGVIGRNGGGKTTMLQLLAGVSAPTEGRVSVRGRVAPLMAVGVGFHPELTGRENVYINGTILGMERAEIDKAYDDIVAFSEIGDFLDTPVKFYSSGMMVRLGMSVAMRSMPDILLVDEVLAVGDVAFQARCFERMQEIREAGATVIFVSHNLNAVRNLCDRTLLLHQGHRVLLGDTAEAISRFHQLLDEEREPEETDEAPVEGRRIESVVLSDASGARTSTFTGGDTATATITMRGCTTSRLEGLELTISSGTGLAVYRELLALPDAADGRDSVVVTVDLPLRLPTGTHHLSVRPRATSGAHEAESRSSFYVKSRQGLFGQVDLAAAFSREPAGGGR